MYILEHGFTTGCYSGFLPPARPKVSDRGAAAQERGRASGSSFCFLFWCIQRTPILFPKPKSLREIAQSHGRCRPLRVGSQAFSEQDFSYVFYCSPWRLASPPLLYVVGDVLCTDYMTLLQQRH